MNQSIRIVVRTWRGTLDGHWTIESTHVLHTAGSWGRNAADPGQIGKEVVEFSIGETFGLG